LTRLLSAAYLRPWLRMALDAMVKELSATDGLGA